MTTLDERKKAEVEARFRPQQRTPDANVATRRNRQIVIGRLFAAFCWENNYA